MAWAFVMRCGSYVKICLGKGNESRFMQPTNVRKKGSAVITLPSLGLVFHQMERVPVKIGGQNIPSPATKVILPPAERSE